MQIKTFKFCETQGPTLEQLKSRRLPTPALGVEVNSKHIHALSLKLLKI